MSSSRIVPIFLYLHIDYSAFFLIPDVQNLNINDYMVRQVHLNISLSVLQINTHILKSVLMPLAKGLDLATMKKKITQFCITRHQHTLLACVSVRDDKDTRGKNIREVSRGTSRIKDSIQTWRTSRISIMRIPVMRGTMQSHTVCM